MSTPSASLQLLKKRMQKVQDTLRAQEQKLENGRRLTTVLGVLVLLIAGGYFIYGYRQFSEVLQAQKLIAVAEDIVDRNLPPARRALEKQIDDSADDWAAALSKQALDGFPTATKKLEDYVVAQVEESLDESVIISDEQFRAFVKDKREVLQQGFQDLASDPKLSEAALRQLGDSLEEKLQSDMQAQAADLFGAIVNLNVKLKHLRAGKNLTPDEVIERRVLMLTSRLKLQEQPPETKDDKTANIGPPAGGIQ